MMEKKTLGTFLSALRKANGLTQRQLAEKLNVSDKAVSRWERDETAPDISTLPALAEIFGITIDELVRGECIPSAAPPPTPEKTEKQLRHLLETTLTKFKTQSITALLIATASLILSLFSSGSPIWAILFLAAYGTEAIGLVNSFAAIQAEEIAPELVAQYRKALIRVAQGAFSGITIVLSASIALIWSTGFEWVLLIPVFATAGVCTIVCIAIDLYQGWRDPKKSVILILTIAILITIFAQIHVTERLKADPYAFGCYTEHNDWSEFVELIETPLSANGQEITYEVNYDRGTFSYTDSMGTHEELPNKDIQQTITSPSGEILLTYKQFNRSIVSILYDFSGTNDLLPIRTFSRMQHDAKLDLIAGTGYLWFAAYLLEVTVAVIIIRRKT